MMGTCLTHHPLSVLMAQGETTYLKLQRNALRAEQEGGLAQALPHGMQRRGWARGGGQYLPWCLVGSLRELRCLELGVHNANPNLASH